MKRLLCRMFTSHRIRREMADVKHDPARVIVVYRCWCGHVEDGHTYVGQYPVPR